MKVKKFDIQDLEAWAPAVKLADKLWKTIGEFEEQDLQFVDQLVAVLMITRKTLQHEGLMDEAPDVAHRFIELTEVIVTSLVTGRCPELLEIDEPTVQ